MKLKTVVALAACWVAAVLVARASCWLQYAYVCKLKGSAGNTILYPCADDPDQYTVIDTTVSDDAFIPIVDAVPDGTLYAYSDYTNKTFYCLWEWTASLSAACEPPYGDTVTGFHYTPNWSGSVGLTPYCTAPGE